MATIKIKFRASSSAAKEGTLFFRVIHNRVARQIRTGYRLYPHEWDAGRLRGIVSRLERTGNPYTADGVVEEYTSPSDVHAFLSFGRSLVEQLKRIGRRRTAETYATAINSFARFRKETDIPLEGVDSDLMAAYGSYLSETGVCPNTVSFYMRNLRAIYNRAVDKELTVQRYPFKHVYTGIDKTVKRAVPIEVIRQIRDLDLSLHPVMDYARDIFMFSFYTRGMSFVDIAFLKKKDLRDGILSYRRHKTNQQLFIKWEKPMQEIIDKYDTADTPYLLPVIKCNGNDERTQYINEAHRVNRSLKKIGRLLGLAIPLTTYVARHGWASIAKSKNIPIATISEAMGHDSENTTRIYLASLDTSVVDKANSLILRSL